MKLQEALKIREENKDLIGRINDKRMRIVDVFVAPVDSKSFTQFISKYTQTKNNLLALSASPNQEMTVKARIESVDTPSINHYFMFLELSELLKIKE